MAPLSRSIETWFAGYGAPQCTLELELVVVMFCLPANWLFLEGLQKCLQYVFFLVCLQSKKKRFNFTALKLVIESWACTSHCGIILFRHLFLRWLEALEVLLLKGWVLITEIAAAPGSLPSFKFVSCMLITEIAAAPSLNLPAC